MTTLTLNIPNELANDKDNTVRFIAAKMYESGRLSLGQAAEMAGVSKADFVDVLSDNNVSYINYSSEEAVEDAGKI